jgi:hypothetical protein
LVATIGGGEKLTDPLIIRPTSEILFSDLYKRLSVFVPRSSEDVQPVVLRRPLGKDDPAVLTGLPNSCGKKGHCLFETHEEAERT